MMQQDGSATTTGPKRCLACIVSPASTWTALAPKTFGSGPGSGSAVEGGFHRRGGRNRFRNRFLQFHTYIHMAQTASFDVTTGVDLQEVDNAINQAQKEVAQRYDFKGSSAEIDFKRAENLISLVANSDFQMTALFDIVQSKLIKRGVPVKNLDVGENKQAGGDTVRRDVKLKMALDSDTAKKVAAAIKDAKLKKVQASIQGEQVRISGPSRDDLQEAITLLKGKDFGVQLQFGNYR